MAKNDKQKENDLELNWFLNVKFTKIKPLESCQVISVIESEHVILDFNINNGGEFYRWHPVHGVMEKVNPKKFAVLPIVTGNY